MTLSMATRSANSANDAAMSTLQSRSSIMLSDLRGYASAALRRSRLAAGHSVEER